MRMPAASLLALVLATGCSKAKDEAKANNEAKAKNEEPPAKAEGPVCDDVSIEARFGACKESLLAYTKLEMPGPDSDCETLRRFTVELAPLAQQMFKTISELKAFSKSQPDACRARNKEKYGAEMASLTNKLAKSMGPEMDRLEIRVRACVDHPGMAEAFKAASFPANP
jgi:hypothetical protein